MKTPSPCHTLITAGFAALIIIVAGCASPGHKYKLADGRTVNIGEPTPASGGGTNYASPHLDKAWVADGFDFNGYDTLLILPVESTAKFEPDEQTPHALALQNLVIELSQKLAAKNVFRNIVTNEAAVPEGSRTLKLQMTVTEYAKGGGAARYWVGLYGGGQPKLRVEGTMTDGDTPKFVFAGFRSGVSAGARLTGAFMKDVDIQLEDIRSLVLDLTDFMAIIAGKEPLRE